MAGEGESWTEWARRVLLQSNNVNRLTSSSSEQQQQQGWMDAVRQRTQEGWQAIYGTFYGRHDDGGGGGLIGGDLRDRARGLWSSATTSSDMWSKKNIHDEGVIEYLRTRAHESWHATQRYTSSFYTNGNSSKGGGGGGGGDTWFEYFQAQAVSGWQYVMDEYVVPTIQYVKSSAPSWQARVQDKAEEGWRTVNKEIVTPAQEYVANNREEWVGKAKDATNKYVVAPAQDYLHTNHEDLVVKAKTATNTYVWPTLDWVRARAREEYDKVRAALEDLKIERSNNNNNNNIPSTTTTTTTTNSQQQCAVVRDNRSNVSSTTSTTGHIVRVTFGCITTLAGIAFATRYTATASRRAIWREKFGIVGGGEGLLVPDASSGQLDGKVMVAAFLSTIHSWRFSPDSPLPRAQVTCLGVRVTSSAVATYGNATLATPPVLDMVGGGGGVVPPMFFHAATFPLIMKLCVHPTFPFSLLGSVHVRTHITQARASHVNDVVDYFAEIGDMRPHRRGTLVDFVCSVHTQMGGEVVWSGVSTMLFFHTPHHHHTSTTQQQQNDVDVGCGIRAESAGGLAASDDTTLTMDDNMGWEYAAVTGDYNPIHLWNWSAQLFGFKGVIAHGMCALARATATSPPLASTLKLASHTPGRLDVHVQFQRPLVIPARVTVKVWSDMSTSVCKHELELCGPKGVIAQVASVVFTPKS